MTSPSTPLPFSTRHIGPTSTDTASMLEILGFSNLTELMRAAMPAEIMEDNPLAELPAPLSEEDAQAKLRAYASENIALKSLYGQGFSDTITPAVIRRNMVENPAWYTAYTPYQAEISQGRLEALLIFQTLISDLTGLPIANASLLDEATAVAEAVGLMSRSQKKTNHVLFDERLHPQDLSVAVERARTLGLEVSVGDVTAGIAQEGLTGVVIAYPGTAGDIVDPAPIIEQAHSVGALATVVADPLALLVLESPGALGADIAVGSAQRFGVPLFFGGPHAAFMAVRENLVRQMPGRLVGVSKDMDGNPALRLTLQTREQHIRREKATSNICTAQALLANIAAMYAVWHGAAGLTRIARRVHELAAEFAVNLVAQGVDIEHRDFFDTVAVTVPGEAQVVVDKAAELGLLLRPLDTHTVCVSFGESATSEDIDLLLQAFGLDRVVNASTGADALERYSYSTPRSSAPLSHEIFHRIHSESQMMRYLRQLSDKDLALDRTMIPLGSCTMKLNPAAAMEPITWPELANIHPYAPDSQTRGWRKILADLESWLSTITGYAATSLQPNGGSMGELAGLVAIRRYHASRGETQRTIILIPVSAHGTNAASSTLAGLTVVTVASADDGTISLEDLDAKLAKHGDQVAGIMITYPSTHGIYENTVREVCNRVHAVGGQVYIDGANMNAQVGWSRPGRFGGDVSHLNLHKTFAIPHGGGGPGVGPVAVAEHLVPFLPADPLASDPHQPIPEGAGIPMVNTKYGSAGVTPITWMYISMLGAPGLTEATAMAVLNANYVAHELDAYFPVLYRENGLVGHETIFDLRPLEKATGITATDVAKRLQDYGIHAPTLAFPVHGTLMFEPTESEDKAEMDRFITAMKAIHAEIMEVKEGTVSKEESVLTHAPFTAASLIADDWDHAFSRTTAGYPIDALAHRMYFPPVRRIDDAYGDRHLYVTVPPLTAWNTTNWADTYTELTGK